ncbi:MAG TPA: c-type cytochrome biogenesis protein CcmI [Stellaceae bacterium]|nr:c-type cytochrome biogenesis protein CcmI [Stellaceae bacterium]
MSIGLAVALVAMTSLALALLLVPLLWRRRSAASRDAYNLAVYHDQLAELERDRARGLLGEAESEAARAEIGRRILALKPADVAPGGSAAMLTAATLAVLLLPVAAWTLYWQLGSPAMPDRPFAERAGAAAGPAAQDAGHADMNEVLARLRAHLKAHPEDLTGWLLLARSELSLGRFAEAVDAYRHAVDLSGHRADIVGDWGEASVLAAGGTVTPQAREAFAAGLNDKKAAPRSRYYLALAQLQAGDVAGALKAWRDLAADSPADADWLPLVHRRIAEASAALKASGGAAPPAEAAAIDAASKASPQERQAMIDAMVERLAARLEQQPDDVVGWARLGRSYMVLNRPEKAREAYARALKLAPDDPDLKQALAEASAAATEAAAPTTTGPK